MMKISLKNLHLNKVEQLSRAQLRDVLGGASMGSVPPTEDCPATCSNPGDPCTTNSCKSGTCGTFNNKLGCVAN